MSSIWRDVCYIGSQAGDRGGNSWRLVLECGHVEWRKQPPIAPSYAFTRKLEDVLAPKRVRCSSCEAGIAPFDVSAAIELGRRVDEADKTP